MLRAERATFGRRAGGSNPLTPTRGIRAARVPVVQRRVEIVLFNTFVEHFHAQRFAERMPLCLRNVGGSIGLRRR